jgi:hypothetical protein
MNRWEGSYEYLQILQLERAWGMPKLEASLLCDRLHNFRFLFLNIKTHEFVAEPALARILDSVSLDTNDSTVDEGVVVPLEDLELA